MEGLFDPLEYEDLVLRFYLSYGIGVEAVLVKRYLTRCQRAREGAQQSATCRCDQVIDGGSVGFHFVGGGSVVLGDLAVSTEQHGVLLRWEFRLPDQAPNRIHPDPGHVSYIGHQLASFAGCFSISNPYPDSQDTNAPEARSFIFHSLYLHTFREEVFSAAG